MPISIPKYKFVALPFTVPDGDWCWEPIAPYTICHHMDNEGGKPRCGFDLESPHKLVYDEEVGGVRKPPRCLSLCTIPEEEN